jgi:hypothetical protein
MDCWKRYGCEAAMIGGKNFENVRNEKRNGGGERNG